MIVGNICSEIGDVLLINAQLSILATSFQADSYLEVTTGETSTRFFIKKFRASQDNIIFTNWEDLTTQNIQTIQGNVVNNIIYFQFRYERAGTDSTGLLEFNSISINGTIVPTVCNCETTCQTIFKGLSCGNFITSQLCSNLLEKLYQKGIIPEYILRGSGSTEDADYISFWSAISCYFSMFVTYILKYEALFMQRDLLLEYLLQKGVFVCEDEQVLKDLQHISENFYDEIRKRGTVNVFKRKSDFENIFNLKFSDANDNPLIIEESEKPLNILGTPTISTTVFKSSPSSCLFNGSTDYLNTPYTSEFDLSNCSFEIEADFNSNDFSNPQCIISKDTYGVNFDWCLLILNSATIVVNTNQTIDQLTVTIPTLNTGQWYNLKLVRKNGINFVYLDGILYGKNSMLITNDSKVFVTIGCTSWNNPFAFFNGYLDNVRIKNLDVNFIPVDGEIIRLTCTDKCDEFLYTLTDVTKLGWCINKSSPLWKGTYFDNQLIKGYETTKDFVDLLKYRQINPQFQNIVLDSSNNVLELFPTPTIETGFGAITPTVDVSKGIVVNPNLDYEITFWIKQEDILSSSINFGCHAFDCYFNSYQLDQVDSVNTTPNFFFQGSKLIRNDKYFFVRGIIYSLGTSDILTQENTLNIGIGKHLRFTDANTNLIVPYLTTLNEGAMNAPTKIWDFKVRPLNKDYSLGFLNTANLLQIWSENNNKKHSILQLEEIFRKYLIPYNTIPIYNWLNN